jgi:hypothetical protein
MKSLLPFSLLVLAVACGPTTSNSDGGPDASADGSSDANNGSDSAAMDSGKDATPSDGGKNACTDAIDALPQGCTRCYPAYRVLCTQGRPDPILGYVQCLTKPGMCWDLGDPNTAGPCVQAVIDQYSDANVKAVQDKMTMLGCQSYWKLVVGGIAAAMTDADRATFANCVKNLTDCQDMNIEACFAGTAFNPMLCMN